MCTASLTFNNSTFCPHIVLTFFVWIWEQTAIISLNSINWPVFIAETESVYCAVRTGSLYIDHVNLRLQGRAMFQAVSRRPLTSEARVQSQYSPYEICGRQSDTRRGCSPSISVPPVSIIPLILHTHLHLHAAVNRTTNGRSLGTFQKELNFGNRTALCGKVLPLFC